MNPKNNDNIEKKSSQENITDKLLEEEEKINNLLSNVTFKYPTNIYNIYLREKYNEEKAKNNNKIKIFDEKENYIKLWKKLSENEKEKYKKIQLDEKIKFMRDKEIIKKYIFKGIDGKLKFKSTSYQIFLNEKMIDGLKNGVNPKEIKERAKSEWKKMKKEEKKIYTNKKKENDTILELALKYKHMNSFILFVYDKLESFKKMNIKIPSLLNLIRMWGELSNNDKNKYEVYSNELNNEKYKIRNLYEAINGIKPKKPAGALRIFLQMKAQKNEINSINEGINLWKRLSNDEKEEFLTMSHNYYLAYKYKDLLFKKKIKRIFPKKPLGPFQFFLVDKKGIEIPKGHNAIKYWRKIFDKLPNDELNKYIEKYNKALEEYNEKMENLNDKIFDLPKRPQNAFTYFVKFKLDDMIKNKINANIKECFEKIAKEWSEKNFDESNFISLAKKDKKRFKTQVEQFEKFGYYYKENEDDSFDQDEKEAIYNTQSLKKKKKSFNKTSFKPKKKSYDIQNSIKDGFTYNIETKYKHGKLSFK